MRVRCSYEVDVFVSSIEEGIVFCVDKLRRPEEWFRNLVVAWKIAVAVIAAHRHARSPVLQGRRVSHIRQALYRLR